MTTDRLRSALAEALFRCSIGCEGHGDATRHQSSDHTEDADAILAHPAVQREARRDAEARVAHLLVCRCSERPRCRPHGDDGVHQWIDLCDLPHEHGEPVASRAALATPPASEPRCDGNCTTGNGPDEFCALHGRPASEPRNVLDAACADCGLTEAEIAAAREHDERDGNVLDLDSEEAVERLARALGPHPQHPELRQEKAERILAALRSDNRKCLDCGWPRFEGRHTNPCRDGDACAAPENHHPFRPAAEREGGD